MAYPFPFFLTSPLLLLFFFTTHSLVYNHRKSHLSSATSRTPRLILRLWKTSELLCTARWIPTIPKRQTKSWSTLSTAHVSLNQEKQSFYCLLFGTLSPPLPSSFPPFPPCVPFSVLELVFFFFLVFCFWLFFVWEKKKESLDDDSKSLQSTERKVAAGDNNRPRSEVHSFSLQLPFTFSLMRLCLLQTN